MAGYNNITGTGFSATATSGQGNFSASGTRPELTLGINSASASAQCTIAVVEVLQTGTGTGSDILSGVVNTTRQVSLSSLTWTVESKGMVASSNREYRALAVLTWSRGLATTVQGNSTTDIHYSAFVAQGKRVIVHATISERAIAVPFYDSSLSLSPLSIKFSVELHNWGASAWPGSITSKYLSATMKLSCVSSFIISRAASGNHVNLNLGFPSSGGLLSGRLRATLAGSADDARTSNVAFGYVNSANMTAAEGSGSTAATFRLHVKDAINNVCAVAWKT